MGVGRQRLEQEILKSVEHYYHRRCHAVLNNFTPADASYGQQRETLSSLDIIKWKTMAERRRLNQRNPSSLKSGLLVQI